VVFEGGDGGLGQGGDGVGADQAVDVDGVGVGGVLGRGRGPKGPLGPGSAGGQRRPTGAAEAVSEQPVGQLGLGHRRPALEGEGLAGAEVVQAPVDLGVDPADEEGGHAVHLSQVAVIGLQALQVGLDDLLVAVQAEQQGHLDAQAIGGRLPDGGHALGSGRDLDQQVGCVEAPVQRPGRGHAGLGVVALGGQGGELPIVVGPAADGLGDDGRVGGDALDALGDQAAQPAADQVAAGQVVQPRLWP
jgi:hypothetical protein